LDGSPRQEHQNGPVRAFFESLRAAALRTHVRSFVAQVMAFRGSREMGSRLKPNRRCRLVHRDREVFVIPFVFAQLVAENCDAAKAAPSMVSMIFHGLVEDLTAESLKLSAMFDVGSPQRTQLKRVARVPRTSATDIGSVSDFIQARTLGP